MNYERIFSETILSDATLATTLLAFLPPCRCGSPSRRRPLPPFSSHHTIPKLKGLRKDFKSTILSPFGRVAEWLGVRAGSSVVVAFVYSAGGSDHAMHAVYVV